MVAVHVLRLKMQIKIVLRLKLFAAKTALPVRSSSLFVRVDTLFHFRRLNCVVQPVALQKYTGRRKLVAVLLLFRDYLFVDDLPNFA